MLTNLWLDLVHVHTKIEIHFIIATLKHCPDSDKIAIDKQVCFLQMAFYWLCQVIKNQPMRPLRGINRVAWGLILFHCTSVRPVVWSGTTGHTTWLAVTTGSVNPLTLPLHPSHPPTHLYEALMILQAVFKMSLKTSRSTSSYVLV